MVWNVCVVSTVMDGYEFVRVPNNKLILCLEKAADASGLVSQNETSVLKGITGFVVVVPELSLFLQLFP